MSKHSKTFIDDSLKALGLYTQGLVAKKSPSSEDVHSLIENVTTQGDEVAKDLDRQPPQYTGL